MKQRQLRIVSSCLVAAAAAALIGSLQLAVTPACAASPTPERFGKTYTEIVSLAKKEGKVRFTSGTPDERQAKSFFKGFREKYPEINVEYTRATPRTASETILAELLSGQIEYDLVTVLDTLIPKYKKTGVLAGPFDWAGLFGIRGVYISPDRYFVGAGASTDACLQHKTGSSGARSAALGRLSRSVLEREARRRQPGRQFCPSVSLVEKGKTSRFRPAPGGQ